MRRTQLITLLTIIVIIIAVLQYTSLRFLPKNAVDFVGGVAIGLTIGSVFSWIATGRNRT